MKKDYYFSESWFSPEEEKNYNLLASKLKQTKALFEPRYDAGEMSEGPLTLERARTIFINDLLGIDECKGMFADISFRDTGVLVEIGYGIKGKINKEQAQQAKDKYLTACADYESHLIEYETFSQAKDNYIQELEKIAFNGIDEITIFDNSSRPKMNIMLASAANNCLRTEEDLEKYLNGETVFNLGGKDLE